MRLILRWDDTSLNLIGNFKSTINVLADNVSYPLFGLFILCGLVLLWRVRTNGFKTFESWIVVNLFFLFLMFAFAGSANRFLSIFTPFIVFAVALGVPMIFEKLKVERVRYIFVGFVAFVLLFELIYSANTNLVQNPKGPAGWFYSVNKLQNLGFNQLDHFIRNEVITKLPPKNVIRSKKDTEFSNEDIEGRGVVVFDDRIDWFAHMWYFQRYFLYYGWPVISTSFLAQDGPNKIDLNDLMNVSGKSLYFVYPIDPQVMDVVRAGDAGINAVGPDLARQFDAASTSVTIIKNRQGIPAFKVYTIPNI